MIAILWRYEVPEARRAAFEDAYAPDGVWARLFARAEAYIRTDLMRGPGGTYVTVDLWASQGAFERFLAEHRAEYEALDARTEGWTSNEERLGVFDVIGPPSPSAFLG